jgi:electron transfer flavoprotein alpha subunit
MIWVVCERAGAGYRAATFELLSQARRLAASTGEEVVAVSLGEEAQASAALEGLARRVLTLSDPGLSPYTPDTWVAALVEALEKDAPRLVLFTEGTRTRELLPRLAARLNGDAVMNAVALELVEGEDEGALEITRPVYGGRAYARYRPAGPLTLAAFRPNSFASDAPAELPTSFEERQTAPAQSRVEVVSRDEAAERQVDLTEAHVVVAGGRGLKAPENLKLLEDLARELAGAVGVSRAVVDAGWAEHAIQVGKSGKTVAPTLYVVAGVSGAIHHTMGMDTSKVVVAINTDPNAVIFQFADYGIVGDALEVLPAITAEIQKNGGVS